MTNATTLEERIKDFLNSAKVIHQFKEFEKVWEGEQDEKEKFSNEILDFVKPMLIQPLEAFIQQEIDRAKGEVVADLEACNNMECSCCNSFAEQLYQDSK